MRAAKKADQKSVSTKPLTIALANQNIRALITRVKRPRVKMLIGKVKMIIIGRMIAFIKPNTIDVIKADQNDSKLTPGVRSETKINTKVFKIQRSKTYNIITPNYSNF